MSRTRRILGGRVAARQRLAAARGPSRSPARMTLPPFPAQPPRAAGPWVQRALFVSRLGTAFWPRHGPGGPGWRGFLGQSPGMAKAFTSVACTVDISCPRASSCVAVGHYLNPCGTSAPTWRNAGTAPGGVSSRRPGQAAVSLPCRASGPVAAWRSARRSPSRSPSCGPAPAGSSFGQRTPDLSDTARPWSSACSAGVVQRIEEDARDPRGFLAGNDVAVPPDLRARAPHCRPDPASAHDRERWQNPADRRPVPSRLGYR